MDKKRYWLSIGITLVVCIPLSIWSIYGIGEYGLALFVLIPLLLGVLPTLIYSYKYEITSMESVKMGFMVMFMFAMGLILFAMEGLICIVMAAPIAVLLVWIGSLFGHFLSTKSKSSSSLFVVGLLASVPLVGFTEGFVEPKIKPVVSSVIIDAPIDIVWKNVIEFPPLAEPKEFLFKAGISYPISSKIIGKKENAIRYCEFNTGAFVEPITTWKENELLAFDVQEQPIPLTEVNLWDVNAPHLHDYFVSTRGQFKLTKLVDGKIRLEGTTWYYHNIKPNFYWRIWSNYIIHNIHDRVLEHIKAVSELPQ